MDDSTYHLIKGEFEGVGHFSPRTISEQYLVNAYHLSVPTKESLLSSQVNLFVETVKPKIPDGGWGWLVVCGCLFINLVSDGVGNTFGILNIEFLNEFQASNYATSFIGSLFLSVPLLAGPLASALVDRYGCKFMTVVGTIVCTVGFFASAYVTNIWWMYLTFGFIGGIGFSLCYVTAVVSIAFWFEKHRTLALSIAASGSGLGTAVFSPLITLLVNQFGWRGAMLIMAGLCANMCVSGLLMRDPDWILIGQTQPKKKTKKKSKHLVEIQDLHTSVTHPPPNNGHPLSSSLIELPTFLHEHEQIPIEALQKLSENKQILDTILVNKTNLLSIKSISENIVGHTQHDNKPSVTINMTLKEMMNDDDSDLILDTTERPELLRSDSHKSQESTHHNHYFQNIRFRRNSMGYRGAMLNLHNYKLIASSCPDFLKNSLLNVNEEEDLYDGYVKAITNLSLLNELHFLLLGLSSIIMCIWFVVPYFYLPVHMTSSGYSENQASFALSLIGFTNVIGMITFGLLGSKLNVTKIFALSLMCCGLTCILMMVYSYHYKMLLVFCGLFGLSFASVNALTPSILANLVPLDNFTMAYGLNLLFQGVGNLAGPPIAGYIYDVTQSYDQSFYQAGFWVILSGVIVGLIPFIENRKLFGNGTLVNPGETKIQRLQFVNHRVTSSIISMGSKNDQPHHHHHKKTEGERRASLAGLQGKESFLTSTISLFIDEIQPKIPDGGWGWLVVISSFIINLVSDGVTCCFGLLYIDFLNEFKASKSATSWIGSLYVAVPLVGGPIGSALVDKYGCKNMTIVGALISTIGFILSTFSKNILVMYLTFGLLSGMGLALCYVTAVVAIAFWFDQKRTLALGLAASGCGFGTVIYSPLITALKLKYGWRGTVLILAGLMSNMFVCGLLQRDPDWIRTQERQRISGEKKQRKRQNSDEKSLQQSVAILNSPNNCELTIPEEDSTPVSTDHLRDGYSANMQLSKRSVSQSNKIAGSCPEDIDQQEQLLTTKEIKIEKAWYHVFTDAIDFSLFFDFHFFLVSIATILMCIWFAVPFVYLADHMKSLGYDDYAQSLSISVIGTTNILGMFIIGFLGTRIKVANLYAICLILSGLCCAAMMAFSSYYLPLMGFSGAFGLFYACQHSLTPALIALLVPLEKFSMAYGLSLLCQGIGKLIGPPLAGLLFDVTQSYAQSFYQAAFWIIISGVMIGVIPHTKTRKLFSR